MKIKLDENMPYEAALFFRNAGFDVSTLASSAFRVHPTKLSTPSVGANSAFLSHVDFANVLASPPDDPLESSSCV